MILAVEQALIAAITSALASASLKADVLSFPNNPETYQMRHELAEVLVSYDGRERELISEEGNRRTDRRVDFTLTVNHRNLSTHQGVYALLDAITSAVDGLASEGFVFVVVGDTFVDHQGGVWSYALQVEGVKTNRLLGIPL
jgi:hypothetical protein